MLGSNVDESPPTPEERSRVEAALALPEAARREAVRGFTFREGHALSVMLGEVAASYNSATFYPSIASAAADSVDLAKRYHNLDEAYEWLIADNLARLNR